MDFDLPGFRFHPTEEELLDFYLRRAVRGKKLQFDIIATVHLYRHDPSQLPEMARMGETEWYFFVPRDRKHGTGGRLNRTTKTGFWKSSGFDRQIRSVSDPKRLMGLKKTLVYYEGRAPRGIKTDWVMNEYRMPDDFYVKEDVVLCKVYKKATPLKLLEQRASMEENRPKINLTSASLINYLTYETHITESNKSDEIFREKEEKEVSVEQEVKQDVLPELQFSSPGLEWLQQDPYFNQLRSLWLR